MSDAIGTTSTTGDATTTTPRKRSTTPRKARNSKHAAYPAAVLREARNATNGATLARALGINEKDARRIIRSHGYYESDAQRTLPKYLVGAKVVKGQQQGKPSFARVIDDALTWLLPTFEKNSSKRSKRGK